MPRVYRPLLALAVASAFAFQTPQSGNPAPVDRVADPFATGWLVVDTNGDGIADFINGKIVVPSDPTAAENTAAANLAARLGFGSTGLTPPVVVPADHDSGGGPLLSAYTRPLSACRVARRAGHSRLLRFRLQSAPFFARRRGSGRRNRKRCGRRATSSAKIRYRQHRS